MMQLRYRIPDRVFGWLSGIVILLTWGIVFWIYPELPMKIPSHFGPSGRPDAFGDKSIWLVAFPALVQTFISAMFVWLYQHPQYSNIPSTVMITVMPEPWRGILFRLIRHMLVVVLVLMNLLFAEITLTTVSVALGYSTGLNGWLFGGILLVMFGFIAIYAVWMYRFARAGAAALRATNQEKTPDAGSERGG